MGPAEMEQIAGLIVEVLSAPKDAEVLAQVRTRVAELCARFPVYA
jgi:glycine/serine hydroxymethyltransferase